MGKEISLSQLSDYGTLAVFQKETQDFETLKTISEVSVLPTKYEALNQGIDPQITWAIILMLIGFLTIFLLEKFGQKEE